jgi:hypothetical protein
MKSRINELIENFEWRRQEFLKELYAEYDRLREKYDFETFWKRIQFWLKTKEQNKRYKSPIFYNFLSYQVVKEIISAPFIYMMIIPALVLDIFLTVYMHICFRLYNIPLVPRSDYIVFDRKFLDYLNWIQKFNCLYCSYVNGLFSYAVEIAWRTERYWCPIKNATRMKWWHYWQREFADYWDAEWFKEAYLELEPEKVFKECWK